MAATQIYPPIIIVENIINAFSKYRNLTVISKKYTNDDIVSEMETFSYIRIDSINNNIEKKRNHIIFIIIKEDSKYSLHSPDLRKLLDGITSDQLYKDDKISEIIMIVDESFFMRKKLLETIDALNSEDKKAIKYKVYSYINFIFVVPEHQSVPKHRIMNKEEIEKLFNFDRINSKSVGSISINDPPIIWLGANKGDIIEIERDSQTAGVALYYRRVV